MVPQPTPLMMSAVSSHGGSGVKTVGYIGFSDSWGDLVLKATEQEGTPAGIKVVTNERYGRADTSVTGQVLKVLAANPDAIVVGGSGTGGALPHVGFVERGYKKQIYHNHGTVNREFIKVGGKAVEGVGLTGRSSFRRTCRRQSDQASRAGFHQTLRADTGRQPQCLGGYSHDGFLLLNAAVPGASQKTGHAGVPSGLTDVENVHNVVGTHGIYNMRSDRSGWTSAPASSCMSTRRVWRLMK